MKQSPDIRKLFLYAKNDDFSATIDAAIIKSFVAMNELAVNFSKNISELA